MLPIVPIRIEFKQLYLLPIITATGKASMWDYMIEKQALFYITSIIEAFQRCGGNVVTINGKEDDSDIEKEPFAFRFSIIFQSSKECDEAFFRIREELG